MKAMSKTDTRLLHRNTLTVADLFADLTARDAEIVAARASTLPTDVMLGDGACTLVDAAAYLRVVAREHAAPGSEAAQRMRHLADELVAQAAELQRASDTVAISIRANDGRERTGA
jgi:hypothetical protein